MENDVDAGDVDVIRCQDVRALDPVKNDHSSDALLYDEAHAAKVRKAVERLIRKGEGRKVLNELDRHLSELENARCAGRDASETDERGVPAGIMKQWYNFRCRRAGHLIESIVAALEIPCGLSYEQLSEVRGCCEANVDFPNYDHEAVEAVLKVVRWRIMENKLDPYPTVTSQRPNDHSPDFRSVRWKGVNFSLPPVAARFVDRLWNAWESGVPDISLEFLQSDADVDSRVADVFKRVENWDLLIRPGETKGTWRMND